MVGVDTHRDRHTLAIIVVPSGGVVAERSVRASARGYGEAARFAGKHAPGARVWAVEGAGHYGAGLARHLSSRDETVLESGRGPRDERRLRGKDDPLDAIPAARAALASETLALPRMGERREALRLLLIARRGAVEVRRRALVQLRSGVCLSAPWIVATAGGSIAARASSARIRRAPQRGWRVRSVTIVASSSGSIRPGERRGRRDRGSSPPTPSAR